MVPVGGGGGGVLERVCARFTTLERLRSGRSADPSAAIIDSRSVPTVEAGSEECGDDAGKTIKGRKRHLAVDVGGNTLAAQVHPAHIQDRDGARPLLLALQAGQNTVQIVFTDGAYGDDKLASTLKEANCPITVEVIGKPGDAKGVVERSFGWLRRCRCLSEDFERSIASSLAWLLLALSRVLMRRLGRMQVTVELLAKLPARPVFCLLEADFVVEGLGFGATRGLLCFYNNKILGR